MIHFISAWYNPDRPWYSTDNAWFQRAAVTRVDDTVTQLRVFRQGTEDVGLIVLNYAPSLRRFLHSRGIFGVPCWSFFDEIQGLEDDYTRAIDFLGLDWPEDVSFHYNPFVVTVMHEGELYARIHLAQAGTLQSIRYYGAGAPTLERIFDDRGFPSSVLMHDETGEPMTQYYLSRSGDPIVSEDVPSGRIDILQNPDDRFHSQSYDSWEALMREFLGAHLRKRRGEHDTVVLALSTQHNDLVASTLSDETLIASRFLGRDSQASSEVLQRAGAVFVDVGQATSGEAADDVEGWAYLPELSIFPLEQRPTFGASANEAHIYVALFVDNITTGELDYAIASLAGQLVVDDRTRLLVCTFRSQDLDYLHEIKQVIDSYQHVDLSFLDDDTAALGVDLGITEGPEEKIQLTFVEREADLIKTMGKSRVLIDLGAPINHHLAVEAVNAGVPQINRHEHALCTHPINGYVISDDEELGAAVSYFLTGLEHWNQSLVQCRALEDLFSAREVLGRWDLIKEVAAYAGPADWE